MGWHEIAYKALLEGNYEGVAQFYEQLIEAEPEVISYYWYLGLAYLLQEQEEEAQGTWLLAMTQGDEEELERWNQELIDILNREATRQKELENLEISYLIRSYIREIDFSLIDNLLHLILLEINRKQFHPEKLEDWQVIEILQKSSPGSISSNLLLQVLSQVLSFPSQQSLAFLDASYHNIVNKEDIFKIVLFLAPQIAYQRKIPSFAADIVHISLQIQPDNLELLDQLFWFSSLAKRNTEALKAANQFSELANSLDLKVLGSYKILYILLRSGAWQQAKALTQRHKNLIKELSQSNPKSLDPLVINELQGVTTPLLYLEDNPKENRPLINHISTLSSNYFRSNCLRDSFNSNCLRDSRPMKIGYIAHTLRKHSVGWLSRWLFNYHNREAFKITLYLINQSEDELTRWICSKADLAYKFLPNPEAIATQIQQDKIDILVDLDSLTNNVTGQVMTLKPAPIQVTWLGMDASGIPTIDYFIADPYVLPEDAQDYYSEKIWRLPHTYLAVDGFEIAYPTLRREQLDIPDDGVIYWSGQTGLKRHPDTIHLQMQILKAVSNSYLLIKGGADQEIIEHLFKQIAQEEGVKPDRLRFLDQTPTEELHRANLAIADVVLDTYPYNGATTTLEVLWMGIPLVTKVGQQFASRNSYTFMMNAGINEGIGWTDSEYIEWGIKLGQNKELRQQIFIKLMSGRKTAPLWNARQFTQDMENAYKQMYYDNGGL